VLQRIDKLIEEGSIPTAFELLLRLERQWSEWPGAAQRHNNLLFADGQQRLQAGNPEGALVVFKDLRERAPDTAGLSDAIGASYGELAKRALEAGNNRASRHFLFQLDNMYPGHPVFQQYSAGMAQQANDLLARAEQSARDGKPDEAADLAWQAAVFWPRTPNLLPRYRPLAQRYQRLNVGVVTLPPTGDGAEVTLADPAAGRAKHLTEVPVFEVDRYRNGSAYYRTRYFESWEPFDLGRRLLITLRQTRQPWETQPIFDAPAFVTLLAQRLNPESPDYDERLAGYIESVAVRSPVEVELRFRRVPARVEPLLASLVPTAAEENGEDVAGVGKGGFVAVESNAERVVYRRAVPEPNGLSEYHVAEIVERLYPSYDKAVLGLRQGEVSMLADLPDWIVRRVQVDPKLKEELFIQQYALPTTHVLQLNSQSPALKIREFRRALLHAIDRDRILRETVLRDPKAERGRLVTSPFPSFSPANSFDVGQQSFDQSAALALVLAAAQQMGNELPTLKMLVPATPVERAAAAELIRYWKRVRIDVEIVEPGVITDEDSDWDLCYRTLQSAEPTVELWPFLANAPTAQIGDLAIFPDWLRHALVDVDRTSDWGRALETLRGLHPKLWSEVRYLPLWEVDQFLVVRRNIQGFGERPLHCYHGIERWTMQAWYPAE
jgi:ABC-type transport system substrate-binding protein